MCGIVGIVKRHGIVDRESFCEMVSILKNRGPDAQTSHYSDDGRVALGHTRLSIIDLSASGSQPMCNEDGAVWVTFNGEIYNYHLLRIELERKGHRFKSHSDTETIIHAYEEWGQECVRRFRGIFAFAIYDLRSSELFLARDHVGVKPLYYADCDDEFIFASQPKAILQAAGFRAEVSPETFSLYLAFGNAPADASIYRGIKKLLPGHWLKWRDGKSEIVSYWHLEYSPSITNRVEAERAVAAKVRECVVAQSVSDVPIGTLLSGGIDSTILTSILSARNGHSELDTFTIGFEEEQSDERPFARIVADACHTRHHEDLLTYDAAMALLPNIIEAYDEPFHLNGLFPMYAVSRLVQSNQHKVVLGGDGGDEIFAGYRWYDSFNEQFSRSDGWLQRLRHNLCGSNTPSDPVAAYFPYNGALDRAAQTVWAGPVVRDAVSETDPLWPLRKHWRSDLPPVLAAQFLDFHCFLVDHCLSKVDRASMACGVEARVPLLDPELITLVFSIDHRIMFCGEERKAILKKALADCLPPGMDLQRKKGFSSPMSDWLNQGLSTAGRTLMLDGSLCARGLIDAQTVQTSYVSASPQVKLLLVSAELWCRRWLENDPQSVVQFASSAMARGVRGT